MTPPTALDESLDRQIADTHKRFVKAMNERLGAMEPDTKERYFALLSKLTVALEDSGRSLRDVAHDLMPDAMTIVLQEISAS